jgi:hypothetical protein
MKINTKVISEILNNVIPITLEENSKLSENVLEESLSEKNFGKDTSFRNILTFINIHVNLYKMI